MATSSRRHAEFPESFHDILESAGSAIVCTMRRDGHLSAHPVSFLWDGKSLAFSTLRERVKVRSLDASHGQDWQKGVTPVPLVAQGSTCISPRRMG